MSAEEFIALVRKECEYYNVKCILRDGKYIRYDGSTMSGCFDSVNMILLAAMGKPDSLAILAHEYCHLRQWIERDPTWIRSEDENSYIVFDKILTGKEIFKKEQIEYHLDIIRDLELNNEKRTVALIKKLKLPVDHRDHTRKANAYIMFYNYMKITKKWCSPKNTPYQNKRLLAALPDTFSLDYTKLPKRLETIFREEKI